MLVGSVTRLHVAACVFVMLAGVIVAVVGVSRGNITALIGGGVSAVIALCGLALSVVARSQSASPPRPLGRLVAILLVSAATFAGIGAFKIAAQ